jgi:hypothetical protein
MNSCSIDGCEIESFSSQSNCILHCEKTSPTSNDANAEFQNQLINHIIHEYHNSSEATKDIDNLTLYLKKGIELNSNNIKILQEIVVYFFKIIFPIDYNSDINPINSIVRNIKAVHFDNCTFNHKGIASKKTQKAFYQQCSFHDEWTINNDEILDDLKDNSIYQNCTFFKTVTNKNIDKIKCTFNSPIFRDCTFKEGIRLQQAEFKEKIFNNDDLYIQNTNKIHIEDCIISKRFVLNNSKFNTFSINNTSFKEKLEFRENQVTDSMSLNSIKIDDILDFHNCKISSFLIRRARFKGYVGFESCTFGNINSPKADNAVTFTYATFEDILNFRGTTFNDGLNIAMINSKMTPNFHGINVDYKNSNRETFRIIKNSLDSVGNHLEANNFYAYEMRKHHDEIKQTGSKQERFIYFINHTLSNFGQSYLKPIMWLTITSILLFAITWLKEINLLYSIYTPANQYITAIIGFINGVALNIVPFKKFMIEGMEFLSLFFYIINISLIWLTITAIKRRTKR